jgi:hypothetical protein
MQAQRVLDECFPAAPAAHPSPAAWPVVRHREARAAREHGTNGAWLPLVGLTAMAPYVEHHAAASAGPYVSTSLARHVVQTARTAEPLKQLLRALPAEIRAHTVARAVADMVVDAIPHGPDAWQRVAAQTAQLVDIGAVDVDRLLGELKARRGQAGAPMHSNAVVLVIAQCIAQQWRGATALDHALAWYDAGASTAGTSTADLAIAMVGRRAVVPAAGQGQGHGDDGGRLAVEAVRMQYTGLHARLEEVERQAQDSKDNVALWSLGPGTDQLVRALLAHPRGLPRPEDVAALSVRVQLRLLRDLAARIQAPDTDPVDDAAVALYASLHHALPIALARPDTAANAAGALVARTAAAPQPNESGLRAALDAANRVCGILLGLPEQAAHAWDAALKVSLTAVRPALCRIIRAKAFPHRAPPSPCRSWPCLSPSPRIGLRRDSSCASARAVCRRREWQAWQA